MRECLICGATDDLTVEHIIPQSLWKRFGIDPNGSDDIAKTRTTLCGTCNIGTSQLHERSEMVDLIVTGSPVTKQTLRHLADWTFWVILLLNLANGVSVLPATEARDLLRERFAPGNGGGIPAGLRVYTGRSSDLGADPGSPTIPHAVALVDHPSVYAAAGGRPIGHVAYDGMSLHAARAIGLGALVLLVVGRTHASGPDHLARLDAVAASVGLTRIHPLSAPIPALTDTSATVIAAHELFVTEPLTLGADLTLLPEPIRRMVETFTRRPEDWPSSARST